MWNDPIEKAGVWYDPMTGKSTGPQYLRTGSKEFIRKTSVSNRKNADGSYVPGWHFLSAKRVIETPLSDSVDVYLGFGIQYSGCFTAMQGEGTQPWNYVNYWSSDAAFERMASAGATAYKKMRPDTPDFSLAQSLLEMKDAINPMKQSLKKIVSKVGAVQAARKAAGRSALSKTGQYWLAIQFGWLPVLSDILKYIQAHNSAQGRLDKLIRDEGRPVRRRRELPEFSDPAITTYEKWENWGAWNGYFSPSFVTQAYSGGKGRGDTSSTTSSRMWCVGKFRFWLPPGPRTVEWHKRLLSRNTDTRLTPSVVYNLIPWTWLGDYFTNLGDLVDNLSPGIADRLVADWVYVMNERKIVNTSSQTQYVQTSKDGTQTRSVTANGTETVTIKSRYAGSPFGFGVKTQDLSPMQLSILGALGLSRLP